MDHYSFTYDTPIGPITIDSDGAAVTAVRFGPDAAAAMKRRGDALTDQTARQLQEYFAGRRRAFTIPLRPRGTPFQAAVWAALQTIPYGQTRSYQDIAARIGNAKACRAVGLANNKNPIAILIPCHRVVGKNGSLTGYAAGLPAKKWLLDLERRRQIGDAGPTP